MDHVRIVCTTRSRPRIRQPHDLDDTTGPNVGVHMLWRSNSHSKKSSTHKTFSGFQYAFGLRIKRSGEYVQRRNVVNDTRILEGLGLI